MTVAFEIRVSHRVRRFEHGSREPTGASPAPILITMLLIATASEMKALPPAIRGGAVTYLELTRLSEHSISFWKLQSFCTHLCCQACSSHVIWRKSNVLQILYVRYLLGLSTAYDGSVFLVAGAMNQTKEPGSRFVWTARLLMSTPPAALLCIP